VLDKKLPFQQKANLKRAVY